MLELQHYVPELIGGGVAYTVHAAHHRLFHVIGRALSYAVRAAHR
jgi:hypothetical protein